MIVSLNSTENLNKNDAMELAQELDICEPYAYVEMLAAAMLRSQAAEIYRLNLALLSASEGTKDREHAEAYFAQAEKLLTGGECTLIAERDQLKAKNQKLVDASTIALGELDWYIENYAGRSTIKAANALRDALKEST